MSKVLDKVKIFSKDRKNVLSLLFFLFLSVGLFSISVYVVNREKSFDTRSSASVLGTTGVLSSLPVEYRKGDLNDDNKVSMADFGLWLRFYRIFKAGSGLTDISAGGEHTCGLGVNGYCWGANYTGQLGNNAEIFSTTPVQVSQGAIPSGVTFHSISVGWGSDSMRKLEHTCGLGSDNNAYCWGRNAQGQLGNGSTTDSEVPVLVNAGAIPSGVTLKNISLGGYHTCGIGSDGKGYCWGHNYYGQLGNGSTTQSTVPVQVSSGAIPSGVTLRSISAGSLHTCGIGSDNNAYCWGSNGNGELGNGSSTDSNIPVQVSAGAIPSGVTLKSISAGNSHTCGIGSDGHGYCWGYNGSGRLGDGSSTDSNIPVQVSASAIPSGVTLKSISTGYSHTCGLGSDGHGYCWGYNGSGQLGNGSSTDSNIPVQVSAGAIPSGVTLRSISAGSLHTCGIGSDNNAYCWGSNGNGELGNGSSTDSNIPVQVSAGAIPSGVTLKSISAGSFHTCGIGSDNNAYCWGSNGNGELGNGSSTDSNIPVQVSAGAIPSGVTLTSISAGSYHTCGLGSDGHGYCWGYNSRGELGNGSRTDSNVPVQVSSGAIPSGVTLKSISAGDSHTCGLGSDGHGYCWGSNGNGELGNGSSTYSNVPVQVSSGAIPTGVTLKSISTGNSHTCGIGSDGHGYCWGYNSRGQLGNGSSTASNVPVQVSAGAIPSGVTLKSISAGSFHTCGLGSDGHGYCWGHNYYGQLGNGSTTQSTVPVQVSSGAIPSGVTLKSISAGSFHTCGIGSDNNAYCWGSNGNGELGNGSSTDSNIPVQVSAGAIPSGVTLASISTGNSHTCGIGSDGHGYCWGSNGNGELGNGSSTDSNVPVQVSSVVLKADLDDDGKVSMTDFGLWLNIYRRYKASQGTT